VSAPRRLDTELVRRGLVESRAEAREAVQAGLVTVDGAPALKPARQVRPSQAIVVTAPPRTYVSRGGEKLAHALDRFGVEAAGRHCLDAGVSTGGFTDCLLQRGAARVLAVDVGYGQVHDRVRRDERVEVRERTNVRELTPEDVPAPAPTLVVADVSFISLASIIAVLREVAAEDAEAVVLVKPQFEAGRDEVGKGGVVRDPAVWRRALEQVAAAGARVGWPAMDATASPLLGPAGNVEFLLHLQAKPQAPPDLEGRLDVAVDEGVARRAEAGGRGATQAVEGSGRG
jgi:23S rRNA (cytidine1920-2'-O)/16S rRNA (cytidine1409-2'-O)-methyltransferase